MTNLRILFTIVFSLLSACSEFSPVELKTIDDTGFDAPATYCEKRGLKNDDPKCAELEITRILAACDGLPDGTSENRIRYEASSVGAGQTCVSESQSRVCVNRDFTPWTGLFTHENCVTKSGTGSGAACEGFAHGTVQSRTRFKTTSVPNGQTCESEGQERSCNNGAFTEWGGTFAQVNCTVLPPPTKAACGAVPDGTVQSQIRYLTSTVPSGQTCQSQMQQRTCNNGTFTGWTGSYTFAACSATPPPSTSLPCGTVAHGTIESRIRYEKSNVPNGQNCSSESQARTCNNGNFTAWNGSFAQLTCAVDPLASCDGFAHGTTQNRTRYSASSVAFGQSCSQQNQSRSCANGTWSNWTGTYTFDNCNVAQGVSCGATPHLGSIERTRYEADSVPFGQACRSEVQTQTCTNGTMTEWTGTFVKTNCTVMPKLACSLYANPPWVPSTGGSVQVTMTSVMGMAAKIDGTTANLSCGGCATTTAYATVSKLVTAKKTITGTVTNPKTGETASCTTDINIQMPPKTCTVNTGCGCPTSDYIVQSATGLPTNASCKMTINNVLNGSIMCAQPYGQSTCTGCTYICLSK